VRLQPLIHLSVIRRAQTKDQDFLGQRVGFRTHDDLRKQEIRSHPTPCAKKTVIMRKFAILSPLSSHNNRTYEREKAHQARSRVSTQVRCWSQTDNSAKPLGGVLAFGRLSLKIKRGSSPQTDRRSLSEMVKLRIRNPASARSPLAPPRNRHLSLTVEVTYTRCAELRARRSQIKALSLRRASCFYARGRDSRVP
jgi:hypothetical protein